MLPYTGPTPQGQIDLCFLLLGAHALCNWVISRLPWKNKQIQHFQTFPQLSDSLYISSTLSPAKQHPGENMFLKSVCSPQMGSLLYRCDFSPRCFPQLCATALLSGSSCLPMVLPHLFLPLHSRTKAWTELRAEWWEQAEVIRGAALIFAKALISHQGSHFCPHIVPPYKAASSTPGRGTKSREHQRSGVYLLAPLPWMCQGVCSGGTQPCNPGTLSLCLLLPGIPLFWDFQASLVQLAGSHCLWDFESHWSPTGIKDVKQARCWEKPRTYVRNNLFMWVQPQTPAICQSILILLILKCQYETLQPVNHKSACPWTLLLTLGHFTGSHRPQS